MDSGLAGGQIMERWFLVVSRLGLGDRQMGWGWTRGEWVEMGGWAYG